MHTCGTLARSHLTHIPTPCSMSIFMPMSMSCPISTTSRVVRHLILFGFHLLTATNTSSCHHRRNSPSITHPSVHQSIHQSFILHRPVCSAVHRPVHRSIYQSIYQSIYLPSIVLDTLVARFSAPHALAPPRVRMHADRLLPCAWLQHRRSATDRRLRTRTHAQPAPRTPRARLDVWSQRGFDCACDGSQSSRALVPAACKVTTLPHRRTLSVSIASTTPRSYYS